MIVGSAEVVIVPETAGFAGTLDAETQGALGKFSKDAEAAGAAGGANFRRGVSGETEKLGDDLEKDGARGGERLSKGMSGGLSKLASAVSATGLPLGGLSSKLEAAGKSAEDTSGKASGLSGTLSHLGGYALLGVGAGFAVAAVAGIKLAESMQTADASIASASGTGVGAAKAIGDAFLGTAFKSTFSGLEMAKAFATVAGQLKSTEGHALSTGEAMKFMSAASALAEAKQIDLGSATETVAKVMQVFGLKASEAGHASDILYEGSEATKQSVESLGNQLAKMKSKLGETSGSIGQLTGLLVDMTDQHVTGRAAVTGLSAGLNALEKSATATGTATRQQKSAFEAMTPSLQALAKQYENGSLTSKDFKKQTEGLPPQQATLVAAFTKASTAVQAAQAKYKELGVTAFDSQGKFVGMGSIIDQLNPKFQKMSKEQQLAAATTLFSGAAAKQMTAIIDAGPAAYNKATAAVEKHGTAEAAAKKQSETLKGETERLGKGVVDLATRFSEVLIPVVTKLAKTLADGTTFVAQHKAAMIALAVVVGGPLTVAITAYIATLVSAAASSAAAFATIAAGGELAEGQTLGATASMAAGWIATAAEATTAAALQVGAWVSVGAAATAAFVAENVATLGIAAGIAALVAGVIYLADHWKEVWGDIKAIVADAVSFIEGHWKLLLPILLGPLGLVIAGVLQFHTQIASVFTSIVNFITTAWTKVRSTANELITALVTFFSQLPGRIMGFFTTIVNFVVVAWTKIRSTAQELVNGVVTFFSQLPGRVLGFFTTVGTDAQRVWDTIKHTAQTLIDGVIGYFRELPGRIVSGISNLAGDVAKVWHEISKTASGLIGEVVKFFSGMPGKIVSTLGALPGDFVKLGENIIHGLINGVEKVAGSFVKSVTGAVEGALSEAEKAAGIKSPSKVTEKHGEQIVEGYAAGMTKAAPKAKAAALSIVQEIMRTLQEGGLTKIAAAGAVGNFAQESSLNPKEPGGGLDQGQGARDHSSGDLHEQLEDILAELHGSYSSVLREINAARSPQSAAFDFSKRFEEPLTSAANLPHREQAASEAYSQYGGTPVGASSSGVKSAEQKAALNKEVKAQERALSEYVSRALAEETKASVARRAGIAQEITEHKAFVATVMAEEKKGLSTKAATEKAQAKQEASEQEKGEGERTKLTEAITSKSLSTLNKELSKAHEGALHELEGKLNATHKSALEKLSADLVKTWKAAEAEQNKLQAKATAEEMATKDKEAKEAAEKAGKELAEAATKAHEEWEKTVVEGINKQTAISSDEAGNKTQEISDSTKVMLDKQAEIGLSGTEAIAAHLQTVADEVTAQGDKEVGAAKLAQDQAAGMGAIPETEAARRLAEVENAAKLRETEAQSKEELAAKGSGATTTTNSQTSAPITININGNGLDAQGITQEVAWLAKIGALPSTPPPVVPTAT